jgi:iron complex outermembrane receptor protein
VGRLRTRGIEIDSAARLTDDLRVSASAAYLDAKITSFPLAQCYPLQTVAQGCVTTPAPAHQNLAGHRPAQTPKFKLSADANYSHPIGGTSLLGVGTASYAYQSKMNYALSGDPQTVQKAYGILNLSAGIRDPERHYEIVAFVNNVFDKQYYTNIFNSTSNYSSQTAVQVLLPRDFKRFAGVRASYSF